MNTSSGKLAKRTPPRVSPVSFKGIDHRQTIPLNMNNVPAVQAKIREVASMYLEEEMRRALPSWKATLQKAAATKATELVYKGLSKIPAYGPGMFIGKNNPQTINPDYAGPSGSGSSSPKSAIVFKSSAKGLNNSYALSKAPNPKNIYLNSRIHPNTYANDYMNPIENACTPLHMSLVQLKIPTSTQNPMSSYFTNTICFDIQTRAQANISFSLDIINILSTTNLVAAFNAAIGALQTYFYYSSILSYESDSRNKNAGMIALRQGMDSQLLSDLSQLGKRLEDCAIPPRMVEWIRYMNGNFLSGPSQGAPILKLGCDAYWVSGATNVASPAQRLAALNTDSINQVWSILRRAIPQWRVGILYDCSPIPTFDTNFLSIFANINAANKETGTYQRSHSVPDQITSVPYNSFSNKLDGLAFAMSNVYNTVTTQIVPGLCTPSGSNDIVKDCRYSYYSVGGVKGFYSVSSYPFLALSRPETAVFLTGTAGYFTPHLPGADKCQSVTGNSLCQTAQETLDFLFDTESIPRTGKLSSFNRKGYYI